MWRPGGSRDQLMEKDKEGEVVIQFLLVSTYEAVYK